MSDLDEIKARRAIYPGQTPMERVVFIEWGPADIDALLAEVERLQEILREVALPPYADTDLSSLLETLRNRAQSALDESRELEPKTVQCEFCDMEILAKNVVRIGSHHHALCAGCAATYRTQETKDDESPF